MGDGVLPLRRAPIETEEEMQRRVDRPCPPEFAGSPVYCYWCSEPLTWRRGRGWIHPDGKHHFEIWNRYGGLDFDHWAEPVKEEVMTKLDEIKELAEKATEEIRELEEQFEAASQILAPFLEGKRGGPMAGLRKGLNHEMEKARKEIRVELIKRSCAILKEGQPK